VCLESHRGDNGHQTDNAFREQGRIRGSTNSPWWSVLIPRTSSSSSLAETLIALSEVKEPYSKPLNVVRPSTFYAASKIQCA
jgi:hypothetical protein